GVQGLSQSDVVENSSIYYIKARFFGLTLDEMLNIFKDNLQKTGHSDWTVAEYRDLTIDEFRNHMRQSNLSDFRYVINFNRYPLFGVDIGHHSPIGGYIEGSDSVFVLDVLEDYKPFLVSVKKLFEAMNTIDNETGKKRGLIQLQRKQ
ncbi:MAG: phytochelatin synthase family protein, partial [Candidatus Thiodiazotropha sp.]